LGEQLNFDGKKVGRKKEICVSLPTCNRTKRGRLIKNSPLAGQNDAQEVKGEGVEKRLGSSASNPREGKQKGKLGALQRPG